MKHTHKYERVDIGKKKPYVVYRCALPDCNHYLSSKGLLIGKATICWRCGNETVIDAKIAELRRPHCRDCSKTNQQMESEADLNTVLASLGIFVDVGSEDDSRAEEDDD